MVELLKKIIHKSLGKLGSVQIVSAKHGITDVDDLYRTLFSKGIRLKIK
jgi:hypothetical protein